jgi:hypothetical protein
MYKFYVSKSTGFKAPRREELINYSEELPFLLNYKFQFFFQRE